jgi:hypothetical protein
MIERQIDEAFLLPHNIIALDTHQPRRVILCQLEPSGPRQFDGEQRSGQASTKVMVVLQATPVGAGVVVGGDGPEARIAGRSPGF